MKSRQGSLVQLNVAVLLWGGTAMFAKGVALPVEHIICLRSLIAAAVLLLFLLAVKARVRVKQGHQSVMALLGLVLCLHWLTLFQALKISTAAVAILAFHTYPVFTALVEPLAFGERFKKADLALALGVLAGVLIMIPEISLANATTQGIALGIVSGLFFMVRNLMTRRYVREYSGATLMFWQVLVTGVLLVPVLFLPGSSEYPPRTVGLLLLLGVVFTALPQTLFSASMKNLSARTVGILATLQPFYVAVLGYFILNETVTLRTMAGGVVILACITFETARNVREA
ncbi:MAG: EamA family transporter [Planctomycetes bacterium]|nr:EamA family transporter [Planctomycetota bacterium]